MVPSHVSIYSIRALASFSLQALSGPESDDVGNGARRKKGQKELCTTPFEDCGTVHARALWGRENGSSCFNDSAAIVFCRPIPEFIIAFGAI